MSDPFAWALDRFKAGRLPAMLTRAGYPTVTAALDDGLVTTSRAVARRLSTGRAERPHAAPIPLLKSGASGAAAAIR